MPRHSSVNPMPLHRASRPRALAVTSAGTAQGSLRQRDTPRSAGAGTRFPGWLAPGVLLLGLGLAPLAPVGAASALLESVKQNPQLARQLCAQFKQLNSEGRSATSPQSLAQVASSQGLSTMDAEVLTTYVIGLYCPDVR